MTDPAVLQTIRAIFRSIPDGLVLRKAPTVAIDMRVLQWVFAPAEKLIPLYKKEAPDARKSGQQTARGTVLPRPVEK